MSNQLNKIKKSRLLLLLIINLIISPIFLKSNSVYAMPNHLGDNDSDSDDLIDNNINGIMGLKLIGDGSFDTGDAEANLIDGFYNHSINIPDFQYGDVYFELYPHYYSLNHTLSSGFTMDGDTDEIFYNPTQKEFGSSYGLVDVAWYSDYMIKVDSFSGCDASDIDIAFYEGGGYNTWGTLEDAKKIGDLYIVKFTFSQGDDFTERIRFRNNTLITSFSVDYVKVRCHIQHSETQVNLLLKGELIQKSKTYWYYYSYNLNTDPKNLYNLISDRAYIDMVISFFGSSPSGEVSYCESVVYRLVIDYDSGDDFYYNRTKSYMGYAGGVTWVAEYYEEGTEYHRDISIGWNSIEFYGAYITNIRLGGYIQTIDQQVFLYFNDTNDYPIWKTVFNQYHFQYWSQAEGGDARSITIEWQMDILSPTWSDYEVINTIQDDEEIEFNVTASDTGNAGLFKAYLILEHETLLTRYYWELETLDGNVFSDINEFGDLFPSNYTAWYGVMDKGGNWVTTPNFELEVIGEKMSISDYKLPSFYQHLTTGNKVQFKINTPYYANGIYNFSINGITKHYNSYTGGVLNQLSIDNLPPYEKGVYPTLLWINDSIGNTIEIEGVFRVVDIPVYEDTPIDRILYNSYGLIKLMWNVSDDGLTNYTLLHNGTKILEDDFNYPLYDNVSFEINTNTLYIGHNNFSLTVRDNENSWAIDEVDIEIYPYSNPIATIVSPSTSILQKPYTQQIQCVLPEPLLDPYISVQWSINNITNPRHDWQDLTKGATYWEDTFSLLDYRADDNYRLYINVTDEFGDHITTKNLELRPILEYHIDEEDITYENSDILISYISEQSSVIEGMTIISHDITIQDYDFEVYLPSIYSDAYDYTIFRGYSSYEPLNFFNTSVYTLWALPDYQETDILHFNLEKPKYISSPPFKDEETAQIFQDFTITSKYSFYDVTIKAKIDYFVSDPNIYTVTLSYIYQGDYIEIEDVAVTYDKFMKIEFKWDEIVEKQVIEFRITLTEKDKGEEVNLTMSFLIGLLLMASVGIIWIIATAREDVKKWDEVEWGVVGYIWRTALIIGGVFGIGFVIGLFL